MKKLFFATLAYALACAAFAGTPAALSGAGPPSPASPPVDGIGSVITSFKMSAFAEPCALGIYRDPSYVYGVMYFTGTDYIYRFTTGGARVGSYALSGTSKPREEKATASVYGTSMWRRPRAPGAVTNDIRKETRWWGL